MILNFDRDMFLELMTDGNLDLPIIWEGNNFKDTLDRKLQYYSDSLSNVVDKEDLKEIKRISSLLVRVIRHYHNGLPTKAYDTFSRVMKTIIDKPIRIYQKTGEQSTIFQDDPLKLYRIRNVDEDREYLRKELFHTPFFLRHKVDTCRYSIAGYPCLYLGTNMEVCRQEIRPVDSMTYTIAARFRLVRNRSENNGNDMKVIELGVKPSHFLKYSNRNFNEEFENRFNEIDLMNQSVMYNYLYWYPLIVASSYIRKNKSDPFASEYIIPQLLMQWVRIEVRKGNLYGLRYFSCASLEASEVGMNYVFPAYEDEAVETDYCSVLSSCFSISKTLIFESHYDVTKAQRELDSYNDFSCVSARNFA
ncbi:hypothetical protein QUF55_00540 [Clostridiaceae bacterium HSG29]|nr:hypothetical protein [Clostridiaceae bacterium HSG29]